MHRPYLSCLLSVKYDGVTEALFVSCMEDEEGKFLLLPLKQYPRLLEAHPMGVCSIRLRPQDVRESGHPEFDLKYLYLLDLDAARDISSLS